MSQQPTKKLIPITNRFSIKYDYILFPLSSGDLIDSLVRSNRGYILLPPPRMPRPPIGARLDAAGTLARKGNAVIDFDSAPQILGVESPIPREAIEVLTETEELLKLNTNFTAEDHYRFYECISNYSAQTGKNPLNIFNKIKPEGELFSSIKNIINEPIATFGLHMCMPSETIEQNNWFDIKIQPDVNKSSTMYDILMIYRNKDRTKVANFLANAEKYIAEIITALEQN